jgi:hypothetical protein
MEVEMSNIIKIKHGEYAPTKDDLFEYELGFGDNEGKLYLKDKDGNIWYIKMERDED